MNMFIWYLFGVKHKNPDCNSFSVHLNAGDHFTESNESLSTAIIFIVSLTWIIHFIVMYFRMFKASLTHTYGQRINLIYYFNIK